MNQAQRNFLIKKIEDQVKITCDALNSNKPEYPNLSNWLLHAVLSDSFELQSIDHIKQVIKEKALNATKDTDWLSGERNSYGGGAGRKVGFNVKDIFIFSQDYKDRSEKYLIASNEIDEKVKQVKIQAETLITRIQLASDKTLDKMINEIDDMGDISLMDTKIRYLNA